MADASSNRKTGTIYWLSVLLDDESLDPTETLLLLAIADHVNADDMGFVKIATLAARARVSYGTARRRLAGLEEKGRIRRSQRKRDDGGDSVYEYVLVRPDEPTPPAQDARGVAQSARGPRAPGRAGGRAHQDARAEVPREEVPHEPEPPAADAAGHGPQDGDGSVDDGSLFGAPPDKPDAQARAIAQRVWDSRDPKPAGSGAFLGLVAVAKALLRAGWDPPLAEQAMCGASTVTIKSCEVWLAEHRRNRGRMSGADRDRADRIITDRDGPSGVVDLASLTGVRSR